MVTGDHLRRHRWSGGPSMAAVLGLGGPSIATQFVTDGPGGHLWDDRPTKFTFSQSTKVYTTKFSTLTV